MLDLHCHILPGIDDGARSWEDSLLLAEAAVQEGITHLLATPHHLNGKYENKKESVLRLTSELQEKLNENQINLSVFPSQEVRISGEILSGIENDEILFPDEMGRYLLVEFPTMSIPHFTQQLFFQLEQKGITPIIVHPERNQVIIEDPNTLLEFVERGALAQVTASSYVGVFGKEIAQLSKQLVEADLVHILSSDAHNTRGRSFHMREAFVKLEYDFGKAKTEAFHQNAKDIMNGEVVNAPVPSVIRKKKKLFGIF